MSDTSINGLLVLDKPGGITSREAVDSALEWFPRHTRMGHTGTLDPLATGVLVLCLGSATRMTEYVQRMGKTYRTTILLGARSDTDDADGVVVPVPDACPPAAAVVRKALDAFLGTIDQVPPAYSAAHVTGRRAYDLARQGHTVELTARQVTIHGIEVLGYAWPLLELEVRCGKGTYIRSLARDLGEALGCGGLVQTLRRTRVGPFTVGGSRDTGDTGRTGTGKLRPPLQGLAELPQLVLCTRRCCDWSRARPCHWSRWRDKRALGLVEVTILDSSDRLVAIGSWDPARRLLRPEKVWRRWF